MLVAVAILGKVYDGDDFTTASKAKMIYQYYCGYYTRMTKINRKTDMIGCHNCGRIARFDGEAPKAQQNLNQSYRSHVVTESVEAYNRGE